MLHGIPDSPRSENWSTEMYTRYDDWYVRVPFHAAVIAMCACACAPSSADAVAVEPAENEAVEAAPLGVPTSHDAVVRERLAYALNSLGTIATFTIDPAGTLVASGALEGVGSFLRGIAVAPDG